jgi:hypothetical protein
MRPIICPAPECAHAEQCVAERACGQSSPAAQVPSQVKACERLSRLFRHTVATGAVNPLLHIVPRYRLETPP